MAGARAKTGVGLTAVAWLGLLTAPQSAEPGEVRIQAGPNGLPVTVQSIRERRFSRTVRQQYDFSCGAAVVATLLSVHYGLDLAEHDVFMSMWEQGDTEKIRELGFSLADMRSDLIRRGFAADGYEVSLEQLAGAGVPAIALIDQGYKHFVVIQGISQTEVLVADPAVGVRVLDRKAFDRTRDPIVLAIREPKPEQGKGLERSFRAHLPAPHGIVPRGAPSANVQAPRPGRQEF